MTGNNKKDQTETPHKEALVLNEDYYFNEEGLIVMTEKYHLKRGYCCKSRCCHCPYGLKPE